MHKRYFQLITIATLLVFVNTYIMFVYYLQLLFVQAWYAVTDESFGN
jgi:hypothetical protein